MGKAMKRKKDRGMDVGVSGERRSKNHLAR